MPSAGTSRRSVRVSDELWDAAVAACAERRETVSDVIRRALESYVAGSSDTAVRRSSPPEP